MRAHHYFAIILRCVAIFLAVYGLKTSPYIVGMVSASEGIMVIVSILLFLIPFILAILFWIFPVTISKIIIPFDGDNSVEAVDIISVQSIFISSIGVFLFVSAIPEIFLIVLSIIMQDDFFRFSTLGMSNPLMAGIECVLGLLLMFKSKAISSFIKSING